MANHAIPHSFTVGEATVSALLLVPPGARWLYVFGHGAGAGMRHAFMEAVTLLLAERQAATFRYQFPYMEQQRKRPDRQPILLATVRAAVDAAHRAVGDLPLLAGGKSMGGRMTSLAAAHPPGLPGVRGLVLLGFPLHPVGRPGTDRAHHLSAVPVPMLFAQGTRDRLAELGLLRPVCDALGRQATLHVVEGADHSFGVLKRSGTSQEAVLSGLADTVIDWADTLLV